MASGHARSTDVLPAQLLSNEQDEIDQECADHSAYAFDRQISTIGSLWVRIAHTVDGLDFNES